MVLSGREFSPKELTQFIDTANTLSRLARRELALTLCDHFNWKTASGSMKYQSCLTAIEILEKKGLLSLPRKEKRSARKKLVIEYTKASAEPEFDPEKLELSNIELQLVRTNEERNLWNEFVDRYHTLGYSHPFGAALRYYVLDKTSKVKLACLLFTGASAYKLEDRDREIAWSEEAMNKNRHLILSNSRFLMLPWASQKKNLASKILGLVQKTIQNDWEQIYKQRPVLIETFVDTETHYGTSYLAANWIKVGQTKGMGRKRASSTPCTSIKDIYLLPLEKNWKEILCSTKKIKRDEIVHHRRSATQYEEDCRFSGIWRNCENDIKIETEKSDFNWVKRKPVLCSLVLILLILRITFSKNKQGYQTTIDELWDSLRRQNIPLPRERPVTSAAFCLARRKISEDIFSRINKRVIQNYELKRDQSRLTFHGHRLFAVDGSKINLPRDLIEEGYPIHRGYYPQGMLSCLYQLKSKIPYDFSLYSHHDERKAAISHLKQLREGDLVVYDRGYYSYHMLYVHHESKVGAVFRMSKCLNAVNNFLEHDEDDSVVSISLDDVDYRKDVKKRHPDIDVNKTFSLRLLKYQAGEETICLGTTLIDQEKYPKAIFPDLYHSRWGIEELYKTSKIHIDVDDFHGKTELCVKQELFACFLLITLARMVCNDIEEEKDFETSIPVQKWKPNFKNSLATIMRNIESLFINSKSSMNFVFHRIKDSISSCGQVLRPRRSYERISKRPRNKWDNYRKHSSSKNNALKPLADPALPSPC